MVAINGFESDNLDITCGVPQGSNLGPLLFLLYINNFRFSLGKATSTHFADDTCILHFSNELKTMLRVTSYGHLIPGERACRGRTCLIKKFFQGPSKGRYIPWAVPEDSGYWLNGVLRGWSANG